jgi:hypothetical protein
LLYVPAFSRENAALQAGFNSVSRQESAIEYLQEIKMHLNLIMCNSVISILFLLPSSADNI